MPRGIKVNINEYITNIDEYLRVGCSLPESCLHGKIPYTTVKDYYDNDIEVRNKIDRLMNIPILTARQSVVSEMLNDPNLSLKYLERKASKEFSLTNKSEVEHSGRIGLEGVLADIDGKSKDL